jgi:hypothetical protein
MVAKSPYAYNKNSFRKKVRGPPSLRPLFRPSPLGQKKPFFVVIPFLVSSLLMFFRDKIFVTEGGRNYLLSPSHDFTWTTWQEEVSLIVIIIIISSK